MKKLIILQFILSIINVTVFSQEQGIITLDECYKLAKENSSINKNSGLYDNARDLSLKNYNTALYPQISINGQATYQSDITKVDIPFDQFFGQLFSQFPNGQNLQIPELNIPEPKKDQYKLSLDMNQVFYDGGTVKAAKEVEKATAEANKQNVEVELYSLKEKINKAYFAILLLQKSNALLNLFLKQIEDKIKVLESGLKNGVINQSTVDQLKAERLKAQQQIVEIEHNKKYSLVMLSGLIGKDLQENTQFIKPEVAADLKNEIKRPELTFIDMNISKIDAATSLLTRKKYPKLFGFGQAGYGRPGLNMLSDKFDSFWIVGLKLTWNVWDWNQNKREKQVAEIQKDILTNQKEYLNKNISMFNDAENTNIEKIKKLIEMDNEIIALRTSILQTSSSKLENGIITATDYLEDLNDETQAKINLESHKLQLIQSKINCLTITGN